MVLLCPAPKAWGRNALMAVFCPSVGLSVPCLALSREQKGVGSWKFAGRKPVAHTHDPWPNLEVNRSRSPGRLTPWPKISHIFGMGRPTNFRLGIRMEYDDSHHRHAPWPPSWQLWTVLHVCRGRGHFVAAPLEAAQFARVSSPLSSHGHS